MKTLIEKNENKFYNEVETKKISQNSLIFTSLTLIDLLDKYIEKIDVRNEYLDTLTLDLQSVINKFNFKLSEQQNKKNKVRLTDTEKEIQKLKNLVKNRTTRMLYNEFFKLLEIKYNITDTDTVNELYNIHVNSVSKKQRKLQRV